ncbi:MAG TPA: hypothetical protein PLL84_06065 [Syntrophorhabdus sp.]|nr:hypothetical protein [Syntrophorhabdus sp.]
MAKITFINLSLALAVLLVSIQGCGPVFIHMSPEKVTACTERNVSIKQGETTRNQVHELLGAPMMSSRLWQVDVHHFSDKKLTPGLMTMFLVPLFPVAEKVNWDGYVLVTYDDNNRVSGFASGKVAEPNRDGLLMQANDMTLRYIYNKSSHRSELALLAGGQRLIAGLKSLHKANTCTLVVACDQDRGCPDRFSVVDESATIVDIDPRFIVRVDFYKGGIPIPVMYPIMLAAGKKRLAISNTGLIDKSETTLNCTDEDVRYAIIQVKAPSGTKRQTRLHITENMPEDLLAYNIIVWRASDAFLLGESEKAGETFNP